MDLGLKISPKQKGKKKAKNDSDIRRRSWLSRSRVIKFLPFLLLAFLIWIQQSLQQDVVRNVRIPLGQDSLSASHGIEGKVPEFIELQVRDKGWEHIRYSLKTLDPLQLRNLTDKTGGSYVGLLRKDLGEEIAKRLSPSAAVLQMSTQEIKIPLYKRISKKVPVHLGGKLLSAVGYTVSRLSLQPDSVIVYGSETQIARLKEVKTQAWGDSLVSQSGERQLALALAEGLYSEVKQITVRINLEELTEQSYTLPIEVSNAPDGYKISTLPSMATVLLTIPRSRFNQIEEGDLSLSADYNSRNSEGELLVRLNKPPHWVVQVRISNEYVQFVKEKLP